MVEITIVMLSLVIEIIIWGVVGYFWSRDKKESIINALIIAFLGSLGIGLITNYVVLTTQNIIFLVIGFFLSLIMVPLISGVIVFGDLRITVYSWITVMVIKFILFFVGVSLFIRTS
ncbi:MAG: hypothetical protein OH319_05075 [Candidatus Parvarchaeota archaeon]|nr:hypothetical protein [Candidatus Jingweiarchaeum tengchongense]MCW1297708.1 hypothetical protein [Candidatus Jingweiarchaeum tengchongense]MCW1299719.1 hypothetical protein [Candidatus Jingweiarchaeum tengchongense]MCW1304313.1 hypothetical protein [Candidatus Jingweiarchaeum tengchongense]MCW1305704.1 hypothetical protein [Candidatus Jingweiarchaeum tengchongense]